MLVRILAVDDEPQILRFLKPSLEAAGYEVATASSGRDALERIKETLPDAILLDLGLPDMDGKEVIKRVRVWSEVPIVVLSARDRETEKIAALDLGADDYVNKPFGIGELLARLRAALRHAATKGIDETRYEANGLIVDVVAHKAILDGGLLKLTPKEFDLLTLLMRHGGRVVTHQKILSTIWGPAHMEDVQYLRVLVGQLRQKLKAQQDAYDWILSEPGIGYRLSFEP